MSYEYILFILVLSILLYQLKKIKMNNESFINYFQCKNTSQVLNNRVKKVFNKEYNFNKINWNIYIPCGYTYVENELLKLEFQNKNQIVFAIDGCDNLASKYRLFTLMKLRYGNNYSNYMPITYLNNEKDIMELYKNHKLGNMYIAKKEIQQQKGLNIIENISDIKKIMNDKSYVIIQKLLNNPFLINGYKINLRIYFLITCFNQRINGYIHNNGFMYYTPKIYNNLSSDKNVHITTGYISREIYKKNPLTLYDFYYFLDKNGYNSQKLKKNIINLFEKIMSATNVGICNNSKFKNNFLFQLFGVDIAPDNNLNVKIIEINKGPDMGGKDIRDNKVKDKIIKDLFRTVNVLKNENNDFIQIW